MLSKNLLLFQPPLEKTLSLDKNSTKKDSMMLLDIHNWKETLKHSLLKESTLLLEKEE